MTLVTILLYIPVLIAAIAVPNVMSASSKAKQKRSMAEIRQIGTALEAYAVDHNSYPPATSMDELAKFLEPEYISHLARTDGWHGPLFYKAQCATGTCTGYVIASGGKDGKLDRELSTYGSGRSFTATKKVSADIVYANGVWLQAPYGYAVD